MNSLKFVVINKNNINLGVKIAKEIFPYEFSKSGLFLPELDFKKSLEEPYSGKFFIVRSKNKFVGITGFYYHFLKPKIDELWLGYFGVRKKFRGKGLGRKILLKTLKLISKKINIKVLKLFTTNRKEEIPSHLLYASLGFKKYASKNTKPYKTFYFKKEFYG